MGKAASPSQISSNQGEWLVCEEKEKGTYTCGVFDNVRGHLQVVKFLADVSQQLTSDQALSSLEAIATMVSSSTGGQENLIPRVCLHWTCLVNSVSGLLAYLNCLFPHSCET